MPDFFGGKLIETPESDPHFNRPVKRPVEFFNPENILKRKVGSGGLDETILQRAQELLETNTVDFTAQGQRYLMSLREGIRMAETQSNRFEAEILLTTIIHPAIQLKANGTMFGYPLLTRIADLMIRFIEVLDDLDQDVLDIFDGFRVAFNAVIIGHIKGDGGQEGKDLYTALHDACQRYFDKKKSETNQTTE